jgi:hypothetical protein
MLINSDTPRHGTGHGVGFAAVHHNAWPRLHPASDDVLQPGMVFNVEPAIYLNGHGGLRLCDLVGVHDDGVELLTPCHTRLEDLAPQLRSAAAATRPSRSAGGAAPEAARWPTTRRRAVARSQPSIRAISSTSPPSKGK